VKFSSNLQISLLLYEVVRTNFSADFGLFEIFERNFAKLVASPSNNNKNYLVHLKEQSMLKKDVQSIKMDA